MMRNSAPSNAVDIGALLYQNVTGQRRAVVEATQGGVIAGIHLLDPALAPANSGKWRILVEEGQNIVAGQTIAEITGVARELGVAEDYVLGPIGFASGIATRAAQFRAHAPAGLSIACGGWKKLPAPLKPLLRAGLAAAGVLPRLVDGEFVYLSKNAVILHGGVDRAIAAGKEVGHGPVAVQVKSVQEAVFAVEAGAGIIMVDTGQLNDLADVHAALEALGQRRNIRLAFGGGVQQHDLQPAAKAGADAVDIGRAILDAPLLDLRMRVVD